MGEKGSRWIDRRGGNEGGREKIMGRERGRKRNGGRGERRKEGLEKENLHELRFL